MSDITVTLPLERYNELLEVEHKKKEESTINVLQDYIIHDYFVNHAKGNLVNSYRKRFEIIIKDTKCVILDHEKAKRVEFIIKPQ